jgi:predicted ATPase/DNA-binding CsgD family transcriptional regulator
MALSPREREVLQLVAQRMSNPEIAAALHISVRTAESHVAALMRKLGQHDRRELARLINDSGKDAAGPDAAALERWSLPASVSTFIGRNGELAAIVHELGRCRLLTLTGVGGSGKTRLALEVARRVRWSYRDGACLIELASVNDPELVVQTAAVALDVRIPAARRDADALATALSERQQLIVMDNCEHLTVASGSVIETLLRRCPLLQVLVTSRSALGLPGEVSWPVPPMALPPVNQVKHTSQLADHDAVALFVERASQRVPGFLAEDELVVQIDEICRRLDGIPLAIEMAAARVDVLTPAEIASRLDQRLQFLGGMSGAVPWRQRTLRSTISWSYDLLTNDERVLLGRLAVCSGTFTFAAVEALASIDGGESSNTVTLLASLISQSCVVAQPNRSRMRYRLLETVRHFALEQLDPNEASACRRQLAVHVSELADRVRDQLRGSEQRALLEALDDEHDTIRDVLSDLMARAETESGLAICTGIWWYWWVRGLAAEGRRWLEDFLERQRGPMTATSAVAFNAAATLAHAEADYDSAGRAADRALAVGEQLGDPIAVGRGHNLLGILAWELGNLDEAHAHWTTCLALFRQHNDTRGIAVSLNNLSLVGRERGDLDIAQAMLEECERTYRAIGDDQGVASAVSNLAQVALDLDDIKRAAELCERSLIVRRTLGHRHGASISLALEAAICARLGDHESAADAIDQSLQLAEDAGDRQRIAYAILGRAELAHEGGDHTAATIGFSDALETFRVLGEPLGICRALIGEAATSIAAGHYDTGGKQLDEAVALATQMGHPRLLATAQHELATLARMAGELQAALELDRSAAISGATMRTPSLTITCLHGMVDTLRASGGDTRHVSELLAHLRDLLDEHQSRLPETSTATDLVLDQVRHELGQHEQSDADSDDDAGESTTRRTRRTPVARSSSVASTALHAKGPNSV